MKGSTQEHLHKLRELHSSRLKELEIQAAKYGWESPAHIATEIREIEEALHVLDTRLLQRSLGLSFAIATVILLFWLLIQTPNVLQSFSSNIVADEPEVHNIMTLPEGNAHRLTCPKEKIQVTSLSGAIVWQDEELNNVALSIFPLGTKIYMQCHDSQIGRVDILLVRRLVQYGNSLEAIWILAMYQCLETTGKEGMPTMQMPSMPEASPFWSFYDKRHVERPKVP